MFKLTTIRHYYNINLQVLYLYSNNYVGFMLNLYCQRQLVLKTADWKANLQWEETSLMDNSGNCYIICNSDLLQINALTKCSNSIRLWDTAGTQHSCFSSPKALIKNIFNLAKESPVLLFWLYYTFFEMKTNRTMEIFTPIPPARERLLIENRKLISLLKNI